MNTDVAEAAQLLARAKASPAAVEVHDREQWVALFARYNIVEDPVGSRPHLSGVYDGRAGARGKAPLRRFYDTFIAPNSIVFHVHHDVVCGASVVRDLDIEITMGASVRVVVPMHLVYEFTRQDGDWHIFRLAAHWEFLPMIKQAMGFRWASLTSLSALGWRMLRLQGIGGTLGFCRALATVGKSGKTVVAAFVQAYNVGNEMAINALFGVSPVEIVWPEPTVYRSVADWLDQYRGKVLQVGKLLAAGHAISASCTLGEGEEQIQGVLVFEFTADKTLQRVVAYWQDGVQAASSSSRSG